MSRQFAVMMGLHRKQFAVMMELHRTRQLMANKESA
jgi:hypothetical protein